METLARVSAKAFAAASFFQAVKDVRYYLNGVHIVPLESGGVHVVATDGHRFIVITDPNGECSREKGVIIRAEAAAITQMKKGAAHTVSFIEDDGLEPSAVISNDTGKQLNISFIEKVDGTFPDYERIVPEKLYDTYASYAVNGSLIGAFINAANVMSMQKYVPISFVYGRNDGTSVLVRFGKLGYDLKAKGILMPLKADLDEWEQ